MIDFSNTTRRESHRPALCLATVLILFHAAFAVASPGAHGPNGEHLDSPAQTASGTNAVPRMEAKSEAFELVGQLRDHEFSMLVNRFETNEPVLDPAWTDSPVTLDDLVLAYMRQARDGAAPSPTGLAAVESCRPDRGRCGTLHRPPSPPAA